MLSDNRDLFSSDDRCEFEIVRWALSEDQMTPRACHIFSEEVVRLVFYITHGVHAFLFFLNMS